MSVEDSGVSVDGSAGSCSRDALVAYLGLGSNLGGRLEHLRAAVRRLASAAQVEVVRVSSLYETSPVGGPVGQGNFLNAVVGVSTSGAPEQVLAHAQAIEHALGRERTVADGPRTVDIDLLLHGQRVLQTDVLEVPHPRMHLRRFVLVPLAEIAPEAVHPVRKQTVRELLDALCADGSSGSQRVERVRGPEWARG